MKGMKKKQLAPNGGSGHWSLVIGNEGSRSSLFSGLDSSVAVRSKVKLKTENIKLKIRILFSLIFSVLIYNDEGQPRRGVEIKTEDPVGDAPKSCRD